MANKEFATHLEFKGVRRYFKDSRFEPVTKTSNMTSPVGLDDNGKLWTKEGEGGGGADSETYHGRYDGGSITLTDVPAGVDDYQDFFAGLYFAGKNVILSIEEINGVWDTSFRLTKVGDGREGRFVLFSQLEEYNDSSNMILATIRITEDNSIVYHAADLSDYALKSDLGDYILQKDYKPVTKTNAMTQPVGKDANGKLWTTPSGGGGADNTFVVNGYYDGGQWGGFDKTFDEIDSAAFAKKIIELHMHTDEQISYYTLPMVGNNGSGLITFAGYDAVNYDLDFDGEHNMIVVTVDDSDTWNISYPDYLPLTGGTISGNLGIDGALKLNIEDEDYDVDIHFNRRLDENRGTILTPQGTVSGTNYKVVIENVGTPVNDNDATPKKYVDDLCAITWIIGTAIGDNILVTSTAYNDAYNAVIDNKMCFMKIVGTDKVSILRLKAWNDFNYHSAQTDSFLFVDAIDADTNYQLVLTATGVTKTDVNLEHEDRKVSSWTSTPNNVNYPTEKLVKDNFDALKAYIDDQFKPHTIWEVEDAEDGITYSSGKSRQLSGSAWKLTGLNLLDNEGKRYARLKFYFRGCVGTVQDQEGAGVVLEMSLDERFRTPRSNLFCATSVGYAINDNGVKAGVVANINVDDGWNNAKCATTYTNFNTTGTTALERDYRLYRIEAYKN